MTTTNEVPTPDGMTSEQFTALILAKQGVAGDLANPFLEGNLETQSDAYFASLGAYFVREMEVQTVAGTPLGDRVRLYVAAHPVEVVTPAQDAAAVLALANDAAPIVPALEPAPVPVAEPIAEVAARAADPAIVGTIPAATPVALPALPFDPNSVHPVDSHSVNTVVTKTSANGYSVNPGNGTFSDGNTIAAGDPLVHLPIGSTVILGNEGPTKVLVTVPAADGTTHVGFAANLNAAIASLWAHLVADGHAVVAFVETEAKKL